MRATVLLFFAVAFTLVSCGSSWSDEDQQAFTTTCLESEAARGTSEFTARAYCECALDKTSNRYTTVAEAAANVDGAGMAKDLEICRRSTR